MIDIPRSTKPAKEMNLIPLANVIFLLLTFFIIAGTLNKFEVLQVDPPIALSGEEVNQGYLIIVLGRHDEILFDDELIGMEQLSPLLKKQLKPGSERLITIKADARVKAPALIRVLQEVRAAGGINLTLATQAP